MTLHLKFKPSSSSTLAFSSILIQPLQETYYYLRDHLILQQKLIRSKRDIITKSRYTEMARWITHVKWRDGVTESQISTLLTSQNRLHYTRSFFIRYRVISKIYTGVSNETGKHENGGRYSSCIGVYRRQRRRTQHLTLTTKKTDPVSYSDVPRVNLDSGPLGIV